MRNASAVPLTASFETVYCSQCHLATPSWRGRCVHCKNTISAAVQNGRAAADKSLKRSAARRSA